VWFQIEARYAGVVLCRCGRRLRVAGERWRPGAEQVVPADRFAREIVGFLTVVLGALAAAELQRWAAIKQRHSAMLLYAMPVVIL
jgi:hypothetical protein